MKGSANSINTSSADISTLEQAIASMKGANWDGETIKQNSSDIAELDTRVETAETAITEVSQSVTNRVEKRTNETNKFEAYALKGGSQLSMPIAQQSTAAVEGVPAIAAYTDGGKLKTGAPVDNDDCVRKQDNDLKQDKLTAGVGINVNAQNQIKAIGVEYSINGTAQNSPLKFWKGTEAQYNAIAEKDSNTFYMIIE